MKWLDYPGTCSGESVSALRRVGTGPTTRRTVVAPDAVGSTVRTVGTDDERRTRDELQDLHGCYTSLHYAKKCGAAGL